MEGKSFIVNLSSFNGLSLSILFFILSQKTKKFEHFEKTLFYDLMWKVDFHPYISTVPPTDWVISFELSYLFDWINRFEP